MKRVILEIDLMQAESRFVAYDGPVRKMQQMYLDGTDIHKYVASIIYGCSIDDVTKDQRQLGKKSGHGANYKMTAPTFATSCLKEMDLVLNEREAERILQGYFRAWDGELEAWQNRICQEVMRKRFLTTPFGRKRYFYDRYGPDMEREAVAYRPQSTIPDIINFLVKRLFFQRPAASVKLLFQSHDAVYLECDPSDEAKVIACIKDQDAWNPRIALLGGELRIPIEIKRGFDLYNKQDVFAG